MAPPSLAVAPPLLRCTRQWWISLLEGRDKGSAWIFMVLVLIYSHLGFFYLVRVIFFLGGGGGEPFCCFGFWKIKVYYSWKFLHPICFCISYFGLYIFHFLYFPTFYRQLNSVALCAKIVRFGPGLDFFFFLPRVLCIFNVSWTCFGMWYW